MASITSSQGSSSSPATRSAVILPSLSSYSIFSNSMPVSLPFSITKRLGARLTTISTFSLSASSSSQSEALKNPRGLRAMTLTFLAPRRSEVRQQSIAVLPTPMISTRSPILSMCSKATDSSQSMPMWMRSVSRRPGRSSSLPLGAPEPTNTASNPCRSSRSRRPLTGRAEAQLDAHVEDHADFFVEHRLRQAEGGNIAAHQAAGRVEPLEDHHFVAERRQIVGDRERGGTGADAGDALAVALEGRARDAAGELALEVRRPPA